MFYLNQSYFLFVYYLPLEISVEISQLKVKFRKYPFKMHPLSSCASVNPDPNLVGSLATDTRMESTIKRSEPNLQNPDKCDKMKDTEHTQEDKSTEMSKEEGPIMQVVWKNVILFGGLHAASLFGVYLMFTSSMWQTNIFAVLLYVSSSVGVTAGAHRLWSHRSYKARFPLRVFLAFLFTIAFENNIYDWARDHRVHHKHSETDADPHNAKRGFFFAHIGWLLRRKHPEVIKSGKKIDLSDLLADPVVRFQRKFYLPLVVICCFVLPTLVPMYFWGESYINSLFVATLLRYCFALHQTWLVNSAAHMWGNRPYDIHISPRENILVTLMAVGEGFHNYHHTFPYDYATSEYGIKYNLTTFFIDTMAWFGLAYDRKTISKDMIAARKLRTGENSNQSTGGCGSSADHSTKLE